MSQENVETVRRMIELSNRGEVDGITDLMAPDIRCFPADEQPESAPFRGRTAFATYSKRWREAFDEHEIVASELLALGEYVVAVGRIVARGRGSGAETVAGEVWLYRFRDGKAVEYRECGTKEKALEAAGLSE